MEGRTGAEGGGGRGERAAGHARAEDPGRAPRAVGALLLRGERERPSHVRDEERDDGRVHWESRHQNRSNSARGPSWSEALTDRRACCAEERKGSEHLVLQHPEEVEAV